jgi:hypothetical protein
MLGSITPLGERGRRSRWGLTLSAYVVGSLIGGAVFGAIVGAAGSAIGVAAWSVGVRLSIVAAALAVGLVADLQIGGVRLPTVHRQVDEEWRTRYRGWVWGSAFGLQLGVGVVTVVTTSTVYVTWLAAGLSGAAFAVARVRAPAQLLRVDGALRRLASPARRLTYVAGGALAAVALMGAAR